MSRKLLIWVLTIIALYLSAFLVYVVINRVPDSEMDQRLQRDGYGMVVYRDQRQVLNKIAFIGFYPLQTVFFKVFKIDAEVHQGDMFWYEHLGDAYVDLY